MHSNDCRAFSAVDRDRIIVEFEKTKPRYAPWVKFLFYTGCRPEEAAGLQWQWVTEKTITFAQALPYDVGELQETKTHKTRAFPINDRLRRLMSSIRPFPRFPFEFVFPADNNGAFEYHNFQSRHWRPLVSLLAEAGAIDEYLPQGHCRHTFITLMLEAGMSVNDVAYLVGNSPDMIYRHYASRQKVLEVPEV
jgi:integrase